MIYKVGNIEMYADNGSIVVIDNAKHKQQRVAVPDMQARMEAVAIAGLNKRGSQYGLDRDIYAKTVKYVQAMEQVIKEAALQGDVTKKRVRDELLQELTLNPRYTMKSKVLN